MNRIVLTICGTECAISSEDDEGYIRSIGVEVNKAMTTLLEKNERVSITMAATMAALNYCDMAHKSNSGADNLRSQIKDYLEDSSRARTEAEESKREVERLKRELQTLRNRLSDQTAKEMPQAEEPPAQSIPVKISAPEQAAPPLNGQDDQKEFMRFFERKDDEQSL